METKQKIVDEYKTLVKEHKTADISVAEICRSLGISRKTFYNYFHDRYAIVETIMFDEIEKPLLKAIDAEFSRKDLIRGIFESFLYDREFYRYAIMEDCQNSLYDNLIESLTEIISEKDKAKGKSILTPKECEYVNYKFAADIVFIIKKWILGGMAESPETMSKIYIYPKFE